METATMEQTKKKKVRRKPRLSNAVPRLTLEEAQERLADLRAEQAKVREALQTVTDGEELVRLRQRADQLPIIMAGVELQVLSLKIEQLEEQQPAVSQARKDAKAALEPYRQATEKARKEERLAQGRFHSADNAQRERADQLRRLKGKAADLREYLRGEGDSREVRSVQHRTGPWQSIR